MRRPSWLVPCLALVSAILAYRIATVALAVAFLLLQQFPFRAIAFFHRWDSVLGPLCSVCAAVLGSRWQERVLETRRARASYSALIIMGILAGCPAQPRVFTRAVMCSPVHLAIERDYPLATVELLLDRYPELINGRDTEGEDYCPLASAAYEAKTNHVALLIRKGANVDRAIERLEQLNADQAIALVLSCSKASPQAP